ncbi:twin-arginine translocation pathway signal [Afipia carboxidovorans OM5]|uniref:ABC transporter, putative high-affinity branched-chain amino acid transport substrate-binding-protein n=1 Tax=Afipia carboxidovorans (strain ATCC 49405 / DSM 1227 / KCTC 32145 / OM5) TaxID=504832 RepID=B6JAV9_AFIC5|nr:substrate-binding protein [Afipia carboxidovorans]ACI92033.1 twin-arginine translocation pathway signal [Afipia carboxidovorans OM5]AEI04111.1 ABC transporter, putative high-affinity branched-chain amino acid transport substrate-binding-protein [Afipia carboxidovorans OM4]AEI07741.1 ABC transporter, putative high-affinity branched-chain amino acid transport substrate-binding-protein [Afipia carboxidovorans OM5]BEV45265.1 ABC transporter substrate-binding protein [Afipia carboxidovorans]
MTKINGFYNSDISRRAMLRGSAGLAGGLALTGGLTMPVFADNPAIGTYPAGSSGSTVTFGVAVPRTGTYAVQGEDELKGWELAVEHLNTGHELVKKLSPKTSKGVLGKEIKLVVADSGAKPNIAVQAQQRFITENKVVLMTGSTSSAVAVALNKLAQREKVMYVAGISGSNDTTGKDCVRYGFRQCFYGEMAANAIGPTIIKTFGKNKKAAYLTPDYTYGHTTTASVENYLKGQGWTTVTNQVSPLGAPDYSSYLLNVANSGADVLINVNWGHDCVLSTQQAKQFGIFDKMKLVVPYQVPFLAREVGGGLLAGVYAATDYWWTLEEQFPLAKMFNDSFEKKYGYKPEWGAENAYMGFVHWARMAEEAKSFYPPDIIKAYEKGETIPSLVGDVHYRPEDHQCVRPVIIVRGKKPSDMKNKEDYYEIVEIVPGDKVIQKPDAFGCKLGDYT